jgi:hypothetical protein
MIACQQNAEIIAEIIVVSIPVKEELILVAQAPALKKEVMPIVFLYLQSVIALQQTPIHIIALLNVLKLISRQHVRFAVNAVLAAIEVTMTASLLIIVT